MLETMTTAPAWSSTIAASWQHEARATYLYNALAAMEEDSPQGALFASFATAAASQARLWEALPRKTNAVALEYSPGWRERLVLMLAKWLGTRAVLPALRALKVRGLSALTSPVTGHAAPLAGVTEPSHRGFGTGGNFRAAIFGVNDGLLSNASLILGVAGAAAEPRVILITGIAGLAAGAFSMAAGEYVSVTSQRELFERQIALEREELLTYPDEEAKELAMIYTARGIPEADATAFAKRIVMDPEQALNTLAREELGLNPDELGSAWGAALSSFAAFAIGGIVPLLPFMLPIAVPPLMACLVITGITLFAIGAVLSLFTGRNAAYSGARMLLIGMLAGATTFLIGKLFGVAAG